MGTSTTARAPDWTRTDWPALRRFAEVLREEIGATRVLLFSSRARGQQRWYSTYDLILVSPQFAGVQLLERGRGPRYRWYAAGGDGPMDLICVTPDEFEADRQRASLIQAVLGEAIDLLPPSPLSQWERGGLPHPSSLGGKGLRVR